LGEAKSPCGVIFFAFFSAYHVTQYEQARRLDHPKPMVAARVAHYITRWQGWLQAGLDAKTLEEVFLLK